MDENTTPTPQQDTGNNKNMLLIGLFVVIALAVLGGIFLMGRSKTAPAQPAQTAAVASPTSAQGVVVEVTEEVSPTGAVVTDTKTTPGVEKTFAIEASSFKFNPATITVKKGDIVKIVLTNKGGTHNWMLDEFEGAKTKTLQAGQTDTISFVADKAGTYEYYCSIGNHRQMGMVGKLIVQ